MNTVINSVMNTYCRRSHEKTDDKKYFFRTKKPRNEYFHSGLYAFYLIRIRKYPILIMRLFFYDFSR